MFSGDLPHTWSGVYFYRNLPWNRYELAKVDTGNMGSGLVPGNMTPWAAADVDRDGRQELLAKNAEYYHSTFYLLVALYANPAGGPCPDSLAWHYRYDSLVAYSSEPFYVADPDQDGASDLVVYNSCNGRISILENAGPDSFRLVWTCELWGAHRFAFGDFDRDGRMEFATAGHDYDNWIKVFKCTGNDQYTLWDSTYIHLPNGHDVFSARNLDGSNRARLFVSFIDYQYYRTYLYMFEPIQGSRNYEPVLVDSSVCWGRKYSQSCCADVDGDSIEELFWSCGTHVLAYRQTAPRQFERIWYWSNQDSTSANLTAYDVNGNGYNELIVSGSGRTFILETEAVRVLSPDGGERLSPGDSCFVRWQTVSPPRCDSVTLFLRRDTTWNLDTLATGLAPGDTSLRWLVPDVRSDSCRIVAIAYGPGWQYDESDACFAIQPAGILEERAATGVQAEWRPATLIRGMLTIPESLVRILDRPPVLLDAAGRKVADLRAGRNDLRVISPGVYFIRVDARSVGTAVYKVVLQ
ncbi:VCBS repeat-containing protein [candidate division WOR-3 bacterium]|nr:VCBS repeat-containing protein [candidate division WOR-3 bacterium]